MAVVQREVGTFVEGRQWAEGGVELAGPPLGHRVAVRRGTGEAHQLQHRPGQHVADAGDHAVGAAADDPVHHLRVDPDEEHEVVRTRRDVLGGVRQRGGPAELLVADEVGVVVAQAEEQVGARLEAVVRAVVDHARQARRGGEHTFEVSVLGGRGHGPRQHAGDHHQPRRADGSGVGGERRRARRALRTGADHDRHAGGDESLDPRAPLLVRQQRPVPHRPAVHDAAHPAVDQARRRCDERVMVDRAALVAGRHQRGHAPAEHRIVHFTASSSALQYCTRGTPTEIGARGRSRDRRPVGRPRARRT